jgi:hypothetical protein
VTPETAWLVGVPALVFGALHGLRGETPLAIAANVAVITWSFAVFSHVFVAWSREGSATGYWMAAAVHAVYNLVVVLALAALVL